MEKDLGRIILIKSGQKTPIQNKWQKSSRISHQVMVNHIRNGGNLGIVLKPNRLCIDVDFKRLPEGHLGLFGLKKKIGYDLRDCVKSYVKTPNGYHFFFKIPHDIYSLIKIKRNIKSWGENVEFYGKGESRCFLTDGSFYEIKEKDGKVLKGDYKRFWSLEDGQEDDHGYLNEMPQFLIDVLLKEMKIEPVEEMNKEIRTKGSLLKLKGSLDYAKKNIDYLDPSMGYEEWLRIGMALHSESSRREMFDVWDSWSKKSSLYKDGECKKKWDSFKKRGSDPLVSFGTFVHHVVIARGVLLIEEFKKED